MASISDCNVCDKEFSNVLNDRSSLYKPLRPFFKLCQSCLRESTIESLTTIRAVVHFEEFTNNFEKGRLPSFPMSNNIKTFFENKGFKILIYSPSNNNKNHNPFGNVVYVLNFQEALERFPNLFFIENIAFRKSMCSRILMTRRDVDGLKELFPDREFIPLPSDEASLLTLEGGIYSIVSSLPPGTSCEYFHIYFVIDCNEEDEDEKWLFNNSEPVAVNHSDANRKVEWNEREYQPRSCYKYNHPNKKNNSYRSPADCPSPYALAECASEMQKFKNDRRDFR